jgi:hypothetical protein
VSLSRGADAPGRATAYPEGHDPALLFPVDRAPQRALLPLGAGCGSLCFCVLARLSDGRFRAAAIGVLAIRIVRGLCASRIAWTFPASTTRGASTFVHAIVR